MLLLIRILFPFKTFKVDTNYRKVCGTSKTCHIHHSKLSVLKVYKEVGLYSCITNFTSQRLDGLVIASKAAVLQSEIRS